jgi:hypothetical protein
LTQRGSTEVFNATTSYSNLVTQQERPPYQQQQLQQRQETKDEEKSSKPKRGSVPSEEEQIAENKQASEEAWGSQLGKGKNLNVRHQHTHLPGYGVPIGEPTSMGESGKRDPTGTDTSA